MVLRENVPEPTPRQRQVLVAVKACGICGSDLHLAKHGDEVIAADEQMLGAPSLTAGVDLDCDVFMGHEFAAEVLEAGPSVLGDHEGDQHAVRNGLRPRQSSRVPCTRSPRA